MADPEPTSIVEPGQPLGRTPSLSSRKSYSRFNSSEYVDPSALASAKSVAIALPEVGDEPSSSIPVTSRAKKTKKTKGKKK